MRGKRQIEGRSLSEHEPRFNDLENSQPIQIAKMLHLGDLL